MLVASGGRYLKKPPQLGENRRTSSSLTPMRSSPARSGKRGLLQPGQMHGRGADLCQKAVSTALEDITSYARACVWAPASTMASTSAARQPGAA